MKTSIKKISLPALVAAAGLILCSFTFISNKTEKRAITTNSASGEDWSEWYKVQEFVDAKIVDAIRESEKSKGHKVNFNSFSRCPSGYESTIASKKPDVTRENFVFGKVHLYRGCSPKYVCDFKVCVNKNIALVKTKEMSEYVTVSDWLITKKDEPVIVQTKKIKG